MKKITMICMAAMLLLTASCKKEEQVNENGVGEFSFSVETETSDSDSKTHLAGTSVVWDNDDVIKVINKDGTDKNFTFSKYVMSSDASTAEFNSENVTADFFKPPYTGYYPSSIGDDGSFTMNSTQTYAVNSFASGVNPMAAINANNKHLYFKNLCGVLKIELYSPEEVFVKEIKVTSKKTGEMLWGAGSISNGVFVVSSGGDNTITLDCSGFDENKGVLLSTSQANPTPFYIALPVGTLSEGFDVEVIDMECHGNWTRSTTQANTIVRSRIKAMPASSVKIGVQLYAGGPYWATCNLGATNSRQYGDFYAWGETYTKSTYNWTTYTYATNNDKWYFSKYNTNSLFGPIDNKTELDPTDDAARVVWDNKWRMPTESEFNDLISSTTKSYTTNYKNLGVAGYIISNDGKSIFLPLAGYMASSWGGGEANYWASTLNTYVDNGGQNYGCFQGEHLYFDNKQFYLEVDALSRFYGCSIRPVKNN